MATPIVVSAVGLDTFTGKGIGNICPLGYNTGNHCAHFVGHVLKLNSAVAVGTTCASQVSGMSKYGLSAACIKAHELYNFCVDIAVPIETGCLIFITKAWNIDAKTGGMGNIGDKHVGIYFQGDVWDYSNDAGGVLRETKDAFITRVEAAYKNVKGPIVVKYTMIPLDAQFLTLSQVQALSYVRAK